jgi:prepilin-type N-terminal cleavage/methylation domain-containing protein
VRRQQANGFTLVELMVVIAVVAILAAAAMPAYRNLLDRYRIGKAAEDVISVISNARAGSVKVHRRVNVAFQNDWCVGANAAATPSGGARSGAATACDCVSANTCLVDGEMLAIPVGKHPGVTMTSASGNLEFDGVVGATTGLATRTVTLQSPLGKYTASIVVTPLGQANLTYTEN